MPDKNQDAVTFSCCEHLDFSDNYTARKNLISSDGATKVTWDRRGPYGMSLVQFCKKCGRINVPEGCLSEDRAACLDYSEVEASVLLDSVNLN